MQISSTPTSERDTILRRYLPLVRRVARRHLGRVPVGVDLDDLVAWGTLGLLAALERFDPARATLFSTYARFRIRGAILDHLRQLDWVPRSVREKAVAVERVATLLSARLGRPAQEDELARGLGVSLPTYRALLAEIAPAALVSLDEPGVEPDDAGARPDRLTAEPLAELLRRERFHRVASAIRGLPERDQLVLSLYYRDELTMKEAGAVLGITESRVSQLHTQALRRLRVLLREPVQDGTVARSA